MENNNGVIIIHVDPELEALIPGYLTNRKADLTTLQEALRLGDFGTIERLAHVLKGSGGGYGFDAISEIGTEMEMAAQAHDPNIISEKVRELENYLSRIKVVFE